jgi:dihydrofolate reductase
LGGDVIIFGANLAAQCIRATLLDELVVHVVPVLLGAGVRLFDAAELDPVRLTRTVLESSGQITDLRFSFADGRAAGLPT